VRRVAIAGTAVVGSPLDQVGVPPRARKMMAPAAVLATAAVDQLLRELRWDDCEAIGCYLGVGASGGAIEDFIALLRESLADGSFSTARFGTRGLAACNPLLAFQLMNNFTMCHAAIYAGLGGPNGALFSRGAGTVIALAEAVHAVASGDCDRAIAGGADAPTHPATLAELAREGHTHAVRDAAAVIGLEVATPGAVIVERCRVAAGRGRRMMTAIDQARGRGHDPVSHGRGLASAIDAAVGRRDAGIAGAIDATAAGRGGGTVPAPDAAAADIGRIDLAVIAPFGPAADDALRSWLAAQAPSARIVACPDDSLAAAMAIAVVTAAQRLASGERALVLGLGFDGDPSAVVLAKEAA